MLSNLSIMPNIVNTGERILLEKETPLMIARHLCAYKFAKDFVRGKCVLDIGCGEGYGSYYLSGFAKEVTGIDYDAAIIDYAKNKYARNNLTFRTSDIKDLNSIGNKFDVVCLFQVIEHLNDALKLLENIRLLLNPGGIFICSTPNRLDASPKSVWPLNKFHLREYLFDEFDALLKTSFREVEMFGLKRGYGLKLFRRLKKIGLFNFLPDNMNPVKRFYKRIGCDNFVIVKNNLDTALDFIAVCSNFN